MSIRDLCFLLGTSRPLSTWFDMLPLLTVKPSILFGQLQEGGEVLHSWWFQAGADKWSQYLGMYYGSALKALIRKVAS